MSSINGKSILVIDDDAAMLRALKKVLSSEGGLVSTAKWVGELMEQLNDKRGGFDLVITDLRLPVLGGESILKAVKASLPRVPVIVITAFGSPELEAECRANGADEFLEKPLDTKHLLAAIDVVLAKRKRVRKRSARHTNGLCESGAPDPTSQSWPQLDCSSAAYPVWVAS